MPQTSVINTNTVVTSGLIDIDIFTYYVPDGASELYCYIAEIAGVSTGGVNYIEGDGVIEKGSTVTTDFHIDNDGNLIVSDNVGDPNRFSLNDMSGQLVETI